MKCYIFITESLYLELVFPTTVYQWRSQDVATGVAPENF